MPTSLILTIAVLALSQAGPLIRLCDASPVTVAFFRLAVALLILIPFTGQSLLRMWRDLSWRSWRLLLLMAILFISHWIFWIAAVQKTVISNAAVCFSLAPIFTGITAALFLKEKITRPLLIAIGLGLAGILTITLGDLSLSVNHLWGDLLALIAGAFFGSYITVGRRYRYTRNDPNFSVMTTLYILCALLCLPFLANGQLIFSSFNPKTWLGFASLAIVPTMIGHMTLVFTLKRMKAATVSAATLAEPVFAGLVAYFAFNEAIQMKAIIGYALITLGLLILIRHERA